ncbi:MAG: hypothetical protein JXR51_16595 [Bacteroidales bacterium]|nr:hypothetical protein [Bacteroidales bacterium]MBN2758787.1 hypothetical protein [Bacteroidales bacterium]
MSRIILSLLFFAFISGGISEKAHAQCKQQVVYNCATDIGKAIYLKDFNTKLRKGQGGQVSGTKWAVVLNKGTVYRFSLCTQSGFENDVVLTLFDARHPENNNPFAVTKSENSNRFDFYCCKSATYYVSVRFKEDRESKKSCAVGVLSFIKKFDANKNCGGND